MYLYAPETRRKCCKIVLSSGSRDRMFFLFCVCLRSSSNVILLGSEFSPSQTQCTSFLYAFALSWNVFMSTKSPINSECVRNFFRNNEWVFPYHFSVRSDPALNYKTTNDRTAFFKLGKRSSMQ